MSLLSTQLLSHFLSLKFKFDFFAVVQSNKLLFSENVRLSEIRKVCILAQFVSHADIQYFTPTSNTALYIIEYRFLLDGTGMGISAAFCSRAIAGSARSPLLEMEEWYPERNS